MPSTLTYLAEAERRGALGHVLRCGCDLCFYRSIRPETKPELGLESPNSSSPQADFAPCGEATPSALSRDTATAEGVSKLPAPDAGGSS